jgi:hypothetical protein
MATMHALSSAPALPHPERRSEPRQRTFFAVGKLVTIVGEHVCVVRNLSDGGIGIEVDLPLEPGALVAIETRGVPERPAQVSWVDGRMAGLRFTGEPGVAAPGCPRSPRFRVVRPVSLLVDGAVRDAQLLDVSLGGACVATAGEPVVGAPVVIGVDGWRELAGRLCWFRAGAWGVRFTRPLAVPELAGLLALAPAGGGAQ